MKKNSLLKCLIVLLFVILILFLLALVATMLQAPLR